MGGLSVKSVVRMIESDKLPQGVLACDQCG